MNIDLSNSKYVLLFTCGFCLGLVFHLNHPVDDNFYWHIEWMKTQYEVSYLDFGYIRRGFIGTVFDLVPQGFKSNKQVFTLFITIFHFIIFLCFIGFLLSFNRKLNISTTSRFLILFGFLASPLASMQYGYDVGRLDLLIFLLGFIMINMLLQSHLIKASLILTLCINIHEASIIYLMPLFYFSVIKRNVFLVDKNTLHVWLACLLPIVFAVLSWVFKHPVISLSEVIDQDMLAGQGAWNRGLAGQNPNLSLEQYSLLLFYLACCYGFVLSFYVKNSKKFDCFTLGCFLPLSLFFLGGDYSRWVSVIFFTIMLTVHFLILSEQNDKLRLGKTGKFFLVLLSLPLGPIGVREPLPVTQLIF